MELFSANGIDLPTTEKGAKAQRTRALSKALQVPLFNYKVVRDADRHKTFSPTEAQRAAAIDYARKVKDPKFLKQKEMAVRDMLVQDVVQTVLGYQPYDPGKPYTLAREYSIRGGAVDVALGRFNAGEGKDEIVAPFELKGPSTTFLDRIMPGRGRSPVQQAWDYAIDAPGSRWVLVSNCLEIRLYAFGRGRNAYETFDLSRLDEPDEHRRLWLILGAVNLFGGLTDKLLAETDNAYRDITNELYKQYADLRKRLIGFLRNTGYQAPGLDALKAIEIAQKLLDRILFIAFAQRTDLMADRLLERAANERNSFAPQPLWRNFLGLFKAVDQGNATLDIPPYNGGLFADDPVADHIILPDHLAEEVARLGQWDYRRDVPVTVLGHLFEQSITDLENLKADTPPTVSKRKREGVVYTPDMVTRFLVERTIVLSLDERRDALMATHSMEETATAQSQIAFWRAYLDVLSDFTIIDPACGSGAFLVAAFDEMARRYRDAVGALEALEVEIDFDVFDRIVTRNLYGVDLNTESVEITRLSLWLKTARRDHRLQDLVGTIKDGNSLIADAAYTAHPFDWEAAFPQVFARGGFDIVIGNPPYVRMEHLKAVKPYLAKHYVVADDRTDLYAYFFEKGVRVLKPGGRLGYISSSTFFKTGSGENLRTFLSDGVALETVVDFGDAQIFEGVTTYPAILTLRKTEVENGALQFLTIKDKAPDDLARAFRQDSQTMPRARLGKGSWHLEGDALAALRVKITAGRKTLGEVYGPPLYGIKTGLNEAFVIDRATRDRLVARDPRSAELLKPFLRGENIQRWRVESEDLFLINTPRGKVDIESYPAVRDWLARFKEPLERRATKQEWWELQQAQLAFQSEFLSGGTGFPDISQGPKFAALPAGYLLDCTAFIWPTADTSISGYLNSRLSWFTLYSISNPLRGGTWRLRLKAQYVESVPEIMTDSASKIELGKITLSCRELSLERQETIMLVSRRILDLAPPEKRKLNGRLEAWYDLDFTAFRTEIKKIFGAEIPLRERGEWESYLAENAAEVHRLAAQIDAAEREIDAIVYRLFDLTTDEIVLLERSLDGQY